MLKTLNGQKTILLAVFSYLALTILHIPDSLFRHIFDKNAPVQFFTLIVVATVFSLYIARKSHRFRFPKLVTYGALALVASQITSLVLSGNLMGSLIGDAGRFVGTASTFALLVVATFHTQFKYEAFLSLLKFYILAIEIVVLIGIAQHFQLVELPGDHGVASTLGNTDFFAAFVGTSLPLLILLALEGGKRLRIALVIAALLNIYALRLAGPLQGYLDIAFTLLGGLILLGRRFLPRRSLSLNVRTFLGTFGLIIWAEFIFLMPFLGDFIPVLGNDVQVKIRSNFWLAGMRQFFDHPLLGVGPDQYGNYYEQYRTLEDAQKYSSILSNDAHSASVQTLATLGIFGTLAFLFLFALVIRSLLILWDSGRIDRRAIYVISLYFFVYLTNSFVSPFTLTHKYLFWAICGFVVGQAYRLPVWKSISESSIKVSAVSGAAVLGLVAIIFAQAQINYISNIENYALKKGNAVNFTHSSVLPCFMYFDAKLLVQKSVSAESAFQLALDEIDVHPRCVSAQIEITKNVVNSGSMTNLAQLVFRLYELAPARSETLSYGMYYANRAGDEAFKMTLEKAMKALGLVYIPGTLG
jgi:O-antigen ligase